MSASPLHLHPDPSPSSESPPPPPVPPLALSPPSSTSSSLSSLAKYHLRTYLPWTADLSNVIAGKLALNFVDIIHELEDFVRVAETQRFRASYWKVIRTRVIRATLVDHSYAGLGWHNPNTVFVRSSTDVDLFLMNNCPQLLTKVQCVCLQEFIPGVPPSYQHRYEFVRQIIIRILNLVLPTMHTHPPFETLREEDASIGVKELNHYTGLVWSTWGPEGQYYQRRHRRRCDARLGLAPLVVHLNNTDLALDKLQRHMLRRTYIKAGNEVARKAKARKSRII
ncbi:hypothetical protein FRC03_012596 [Tulasnella sp. 419]|nr:hypothetical protein FRC03_012596 [Tulasnella sp. 419]